MFKIGVIGSGKIAKRFIPEVSFVPGCEVRCIYNPRIEGARTLIEDLDLGIEGKKIEPTDDLEKLFSLCDGVYIATPHEFHAEYTKAALYAGRHVLCEKPMAFSRDEAQDLFALAKDRELILMEALKTAYFPGFRALVDTAKDGRIGKIRDVEAGFTKLLASNERPFISQLGGAFTELSAYPMLGIFKILGCEYSDVSFRVFKNVQGVDVYAKADFIYPEAVATAKVGIGVKSEGSLTVSGETGYLHASSPWWLTRKYALCFEDERDNLKYACELEGDGFRYEIAGFKEACTAASSAECMYPNLQESLAMADVYEKFIQGKKTCFIG